jgi:hypothetical protein
LGLSIVPDCSFLSPASWATARSRRNTLEPPKERVIAFMQREHVRTHSRSGRQRQRIPVGPHAEPHARTGNEVSAITVGSDAANPDAAISLARPGPTAGARPTRPKTVTSPGATEALRHQLRPWTIRPQPQCLRRHRLVAAKRPTQRPHRRNLVLANHSPRWCPRPARRPEVL